MSEKNKEIYSLAGELFLLRQKKKSMEDELKDLNADIKEIEEHKLSDILNEECINRIELDNLEISKSTVFRAPVTKHTDKEAFQYLFDTCNDGALKQMVLIDLAAYPLVCSLLDENKIPYKIEYSIHHATLSSIIKELVMSGKFSTDDIEKYNVYVQPQIKVKQKN